MPHEVDRYFELIKLDKIKLAKMDNKRILLKIKIGIMTHLFIHRRQSGICESGLTLRYIDKYYSWRLIKSSHWGGNESSSAFNI